MFQENEIVMIILGLATLIFIYLNRLKIKQLPSAALFLNGFYIVLAGWVFTVLEGLFLNELLNYLEHLSYALSAVILTAWCWRVFYKKSDMI